MARGGMNVNPGVGGGKPQKIRDVAPVYPDEARKANVSGVVILEMTVGVDGSVTNPRVLRSIPLLDEAAVAAVSQWQYQPVLMNGTAVPVRHHGGGAGRAVAGFIRRGAHLKAPCILLGTMASSSSGQKGCRFDGNGGLCAQRENWR